MNKKKHIFLIITSHELIIVRNIIKTLIKDEDYSIFIFNEFNEMQFDLVSEFKDIVFCNSKNLRSKLNFFKLIEYMIKEDSKHKEIFFYSSQYINFISNYFLRKKNIKKILISHGISNYVSSHDDYTRNFNTLNKFSFVQRVFNMQKLFDKLTKIINLTKQFFILSLLFKLYDFNFKHTTAYEKIQYDMGYFFFLKNLITKTKKDIKIDFEEYNLDVPKNNYVLYMEERFSSTVYDKKDRNKLIKYLDSLKNITVIQKPHPNMDLKKIKKIETKHKVIIASRLVPAEYYIQKNRVTTIIGPESSVLLNAKFINKDNNVILFDSNVKQSRHIKKLANDFDIKIFD